MKGQFAKGGVSPKRKLWEFRVSENALLPTGTPLTAAHFVPGQHVDVCAKRLVVCSGQLLTYSFVWVSLSKLNSEVVSLYILIIILSLYCYVYL